MIYMVAFTNFDMAVIAFAPLGFVLAFYVSPSMSTLCAKLESAAISICGVLPFPVRCYPTTGISFATFFNCFFVLYVMVVVVPSGALWIFSHPLQTILRQPSPVAFVIAVSALFAAVVVSIGTVFVIGEQLYRLRGLALGAMLEWRGIINHVTSSFQLLTKSQGVPAPLGQLFSSFNYTTGGAV